MINEQTIQHLSNLCKLEFSDNEKTQIIEDLNNILNFIDKIKKVDTSDVEPLIYMSDRNNIFRNDSETQSTSQKDALNNSPSNSSKFFVVPKIL